MHLIAKISKVPLKRSPAINISVILYLSASAERFRAMKLHFTSLYLQINPLL